MISIILTSTSVSMGNIDFVSIKYIYIYVRMLIFGLNAWEKTHPSMCIVQKLYICTVATPEWCMHVEHTPLSCTIYQKVNDPQWMIIYHSSPWSYRTDNTFCCHHILVVGEPKYRGLGWLVKYSAVNVGCIYKPMYGTWVTDTGHFLATQILQALFRLRMDPWHSSFGSLEHSALSQRKLSFSSSYEVIFGFWSTIAMKWNSNEFIVFYSEVLACYEYFYIIQEVHFVFKILYYLYNKHMESFNIMKYKYLVTQYYRSAIFLCLCIHVCMCMYAHTLSPL